MMSYITVGELAKHLNCQMIGDSDKKIYGISLFKESTEDMLTYVPYNKINVISEVEAGAIITRASIGLPIHRNYIIVKNDPYEVLAQTIQFMLDKGMYDNLNYHKPEISSSSVIGDYVDIGNGSVIGDNTLLSSGVVIGENVQIGKNCVIGANTVIGSNCMIGDNVVIGACCSIGTENFEYYHTYESWIKIPVIGNVIISDNVRIGGSVVIEKGTIGTTVIGNDTQIENLVQIGHEVKIGANCHIVACTALAGWVEIGNHVTIYGQAAVSNHVKIGNHVVLLARTGVDKNIADKSIVSGSPAQSHKQEMRFQAFLRKLFRMNMKGCELK